MHFDERPIVPPCSSSYRGSSSVSRPHAEQRVEVAPSSSRRRTHEDSNAKDDVPLIWQRMSSEAQPVQPVMVHSSNVPPTSARDAVKTMPASTSASDPRIVYLEGFS
ncbi:hypothetical protein SLEP1_g28718 [Rubroshorea leprosula]|uniref:Uncharacterized protein n=1 Tax=Rubroshorea leprosula TaxID=152421 RepID=A0AAV5K1N9_9ROSI|nr:hypothetical protein SLEP1_g28718 [Rubroshorea leprosula]